MDPPLPVANVVFKVVANNRATGIITYILFFYFFIIFILKKLVCAPCLRHRCVILPTDLPTYRLTYLQIHNLATYRHTYLLTYLPTDPPTYLPTAWMTN